MPNRLALENSPYLLQHADNPVEWYPWGEEALQRARAENKPIFLSIGYAACHWCHVMAHESFENPGTAAIMNTHFINIKVDREERPDLDQIYMQAVVAISGNGGWPMSVFLTPDGKPFYGGTYFPPQRKFNIPSFAEILHTIAGIWEDDRTKLLESSQQITQQIHKNQFHPGTSPPLNLAFLEQASLHLAQSYDWKFGGWGSAPKFPQPMAIDFLLLRSLSGDKLALDVAAHALKAMSQGGMYDVIGGGFARYSTDDHWLVPHFEKMLYDNVQLSRVYLHAYLITRESDYRRICEETLDFILRELSNSTRSTETNWLCFFSSLDADSEGKEGKFYIWKYEELKDTLRSAQKESYPATGVDWFELFEAAYHLSPQGNFEGYNVLQRKTDDQTLGKDFKLEIERLQEILKLIHDHLMAVRQTRIRPGLDDKALTSWNALALVAFAEAARYLDRGDYLKAAIQNAAFLVTELLVDGKLMRSWRDGRSQHSAYLEDYAGLILGLLSLYQSDPDTRWYVVAVQLGTEMLEHFSDETGGFFDTRDDQDTLIMRPKDLQDNATPSGNALAVMALLALASFTGNSSWRLRAENSLQAIQESAARYPTAFALWLCALDFAAHKTQEIAILGKAEHPGTVALRKVLWEKYRSHAVAAISAHPPHPDSPPLLKDRVLFNQLPTAFVCENFTCKLPVNSPEEFERQLNEPPLRNHRIG